MALRVADDEPRQQSGRGRLEHPPRGRGERLPQRRRRSAADHPDRRASDGGPRAESTATTRSPGLRRRDADPHAGPLTGEQVRASRPPARTAAPRRPRRYVVSPTTSRVTVASTTIRGPPAPPSTCGSPSSSSDDGDGPPLLGDRPQRRGLPRRAADRRGGRGDRDAGDERQEDRRPPDPDGDRSRTPATQPGTRRPSASSAGRPASGAARVVAQTPAPPRARAAGPASASGRASVGAHTVTSSASSAAIAGPMPGTSSSSSTLRNGPLLGAVVDDPLGEHRADARQRVELGHRRRVFRSTSPPAPPAGARRRPVRPRRPVRRRRSAARR